MKILQKIVAAICAVAVTATIISPISIGDNSARAEEVQRISETNETVDSPDALSDEEKPMSGKCGDNLTWVLDDEGTLTISGTGDMFDYNRTGESPWLRRDDIKSVFIEDGATRIGTCAFEDITNLTSVTIPNSITSIGVAAFSNCTRLISVTIPNSVKSIDGQVFYGCTSLVSLTIPNGVINIGDYAFYDCKSLVSITIPNSVTSIGDGAFCDCTGLISMTTPKSVTIIGERAFAGCKRLTSVTISEGTTDIKNYAFMGCTKLASITIPKSITHIGYEAFSGCTSLENVYYTGTERQWYAIGHGGHNDCLTNANIHYNSTGSKDIGEPIGEKVSFNGHTYQVFRLDDVTGREAISYCNKIGGYMAHINDSEENAFLSNYIRESNIGYAYFGYTDEETEGNWKWVDGKNSSYTNWDTNEPNDEYGKEDYALIRQSGFWNDGKFESDASTGGVFVICEWEGEESTEQAVGNVHFLSSYDPETGKVKFDESSTSISLDYTLSDTVDKSAASSMINKYVLAEIDTSINTVTALKPVESKIGTISAIDTTALTITIDGEVYPLSKDNSVLTLFADQQIGNTVLYHIYQGAVVGCNSIEKKIGMLKSWDYTNQELVIDDIVYPINFLTDISFLANVDQLFEKKVVFVGSSCNEQFFVFKLVPYTEMLNTPQKDVYTIEVGSEGTIYANIPLQSNALSVDYSWISSDGKIVSFVQGLSLSNIDGTYSGNMSVKNAIISIPFYACSEGEASVTCTLADGTAVAIHKIKVVKSGSNEKVIESNNYNVYKYSQNSFENYNQYIERWYDAYEKYIQSILNAARQSSDSDYENNIEKQAKAMMQLDEKSLSPNLTFDELKPSAEVKLSAYKALCETIQPVVDKQINLDKIDLKDTTSFSSSTCKAIANAAFKTSATYEYGDVVVEVSYGGLQIGVGSMVCYKKNKPYDKHYVMICPTLGSSTKCIEDYLTQLVKLEYKAIDNVYNSLAKDICGKTLSKLTAEYLGKKFTKQLTEKIKAMGAGDIKGDLITLNIAWKNINNIGKKVISNEEITLEDLGKLKNCIEFDDSSIEDRATKKALKAISKAQNDLYDEINRVVSNHAGEINPPKETLPQMIKSWFTCPVNISIYKDGEQIGYVGDDDIWYNDDIYIEEKGGAKIIYSTPGDSISFKITGNDDGLFSYSIEEYDSNKPTGRVNFYNIPVENGKSINVDLPTSNLADNTNNFKLEGNSASYLADEYIPVNDSAGVNIKASVRDNTGGQIHGSGEYVRGDAAVLYAIPDEKYIFNGWFDTNGKLVSIANVYEFCARDDGNYIAYFSLDNEDDIETYTISFIAVGGITSDTMLTTDENGKLSKLPVATRDGYIFDGWFTAAENGEKITTDTVFTKDTAIYAHWTKNMGNSESPSIPDTSDSSNSDDNGTDSDTAPDSGANVDSESSADSEVSSDSFSDDTSNNSKPGDSTSGTDSDDLDTNNPSTGVTVAIVPILLAAGASVVIFRKKNEK